MTVKDTIQEKLLSTLAPLHLEVINESHKHAVPQNSETHFKLVVVSDTFEGESLIKRHRMLNNLLDEELKNGVHALSLHTMTPTEWEKKQGKVADTPDCLGGDKGAGKSAG